MTVKYRKNWVDISYRKRPVEQRWNPSMWQSTASRYILGEITHMRLCVCVFVSVWQRLTTWLSWRPGSDFCLHKRKPTTSRNLMTCLHCENEMLWEVSVSPPGTSRGAWMWEAASVNALKRKCSHRENTWAASVALQTGAHTLSIFKCTGKHFCVSSLFRVQQNTNLGNRILLIHSSWKRLYLLSNSTRWRKCFLLDFAPFWIRINAAVPCELFLNRDLSFKLKSAKTLECEKINTLF